MLKIPRLPGALSIFSARVSNASVLDEEGNRGHDKISRDAGGADSFSAFGFNRREARTLRKQISLNAAGVPCPGV